MRCERINQWLGEHLDGSLDADRTREVNEHLAGCATCRRELEELRQTVALVRGLAPVAPPADLLPSVHRRLAQPHEAPWMICWRVLSLPQTRMAAAAALFMMIGLYGWRTLTADHGRVENDVAAPRTLATVRPAPAQDRASLSSILQDSKMERVAESTTPSPVPADKPAVAEANAPRELEASGRVWAEPAPKVRREKKKASQAFKAGLTVGEGSEIAPDRETAVAGFAAAGPAEKLAPAKSLAKEERATRPTAAQPAAPPAVLAKPARQETREIALTTRDRAAVRKILDQYVVPGKEALHSEGASAPAGKMGAKGGASRLDQSAGTETLITGWIPAARYKQLLADLKSVETTSLPETRERKSLADTDDLRLTLSSANESDDTELLFVRITLIPPVN
ncbi:MAG: zf-HC2 domain-containing protein [bacterium]